jgi:pimeloyl-ACP methyl ester carboxylesterase
MSKALFTEIVDTRLTRGQILGLMHRVVDLGLNYRFEANDLSEWPGRVLLLVGEDDPATPPAARQALLAMYPRARVRTFSGAGHLTAIVKQEEYFAEIDGFLNPHPPGL